MPARSNRRTKPWLKLLTSVRALPGASCTHNGYDANRPIIQIRDVPEEVRDALAVAAEAQGLSFAGYVRRELERLAKRRRWCVTMLL